MVNNFLPVTFYLSTHNFNQVKQLYVIILCASERKSYNPTFRIVKR